MERTALLELHFITDIRNVGSILERGILSHDRAKKLHPVSIAMAEIQTRRASRWVPGGRRLHEYACLYLDARNPMLYKRRADAAGLTVLRVSTDALDIPGAVVTDGNASSDYTAFYPSPGGLQHLVAEDVFARYWNSSDYYEYLQQKRTRCAELLIPERVPPVLIMGAYICSSAAGSKLREVAGDLPIDQNRYLFFGAGS